MVAVIVGVWVFGWTDVFHLVDTTAFGAALDGAFAGDLCGEEEVSWMCWRMRKGDRERISG